MILTGEQRLEIAKGVLIEYAEKEEDITIANHLINTLIPLNNSYKNKPVLEDIELEDIKHENK